MAVSMAFMYYDGSPVSRTGLGLEYAPYENADSIREVVAMTVTSWAEEDRIPSPLKFAQELHNHLVCCNHRSDEENILYDFDEHYKLKFTINEVPYYFETWRTWQGALNWVIEEDLA